MKAVLLLSFFLFAFLGVQASKVKVVNNCGTRIEVWEVVSNKPGPNSPLKTLNAGASFTKDYPNPISFVLKRGRQGKSLAEFTFNDANMHFDWYDVSRVVGYDYPIRITPPTGRECSNERSQCLNSRCGPPEAYAKHNDDTATKACRKTGGQFTVTFCAK